MIRNISNIPNTCYDTCSGLCTSMVKQHDYPLSPRASPTYRGATTWPTRWSSHDTLPHTPPPLLWTSHHNIEAIDTDIQQPPLKVRFLMKRRREAVGDIYFGPPLWPSVRLHISLCPARQCSTWHSLEQSAKEVKICYGDGAAKSNANGIQIHFGYH